MLNKQQIIIIGFFLFHKLQLYQVVFIMIKSAISPRPASWVLERSIDGLDFLPWQYFGASDYDCQQRYNLPARHGAYEFQTNSEVICSTKFSKPIPLENGEVNHINQTLHGL